MTRIFEQAFGTGKPSYFSLNLLPHNTHPFVSIPTMATLVHVSLFSWGTNVRHTPSKWQSKARKFGVPFIDNILIWRGPERAFDFDSRLHSDENVYIWRNEICTLRGLAEVAFRIMFKLWNKNRARNTTCSRAHAMHRCTRYHAVQVCDLCGGEVQVACCEWMRSDHLVVEWQT